MFSVVRWLLVTQPCRFYLACEDAGVVPWRYLGVAGGISALGAALGAGWARLADADSADAVALGIVAGPAILGCLGLQSLLVMIVLWIRGTGPDEVLDRGAMSARGARGTGPSGRHADPPGRIPWRRAGRDPLVPWPLVAFFALVSAVAVLDVGWIHHRERAYSGPRQVTTAFIDSYDDGRFGLGRRRLHIIFEVEGRLVRASVRAEDIDGVVPQPGRSTSVEYLVADPLRVRPEGTSRRAQEEADFSRGVAVLCLVLMVLTGAFRVIALLRRRAR